MCRAASRRAAGGGGDGAWGARRDWAALQGAHQRTRKRDIALSPCLAYLFYATTEITSAKSGEGDPVRLCDLTVEAYAARASVAVINPIPR